jgi:hypothetical protein
MHRLLLLLLLLMFNYESFAQPGVKDCSVEGSNSTVERKDHLNFFVISKRKKGKLDLATRFNVFRTKLRGISHPNTFISVIASDMNDAVTKIKRNLEGNNANLGTLWFDSHGAYKKGYSSFMIGHDECNSKILSDTNLKLPLAELAAYTTRSTRVIIGSCYGGATYIRTSVDYKDTFRMDGDSLMKALGRIFINSTVYASESWVMSKPGLFNRKPAVGGNPGRKLFLDLCYQPAWENIGVWNQYDSYTGSFAQSNTVALDKEGNLVIRGESYKEEKKLDKKIHKSLYKLQPNLYK